LTSDIIVGFPGETESDFQDTLKLIDECQYDGLYIFKYSKRPGTPAAKLPDDVTESEKRARFLELESRQREIQNKIYQSYVGRTVSVLVEGESAKSPEDLTGHSTCHKVVNFYSGATEQGQISQVRITKAKSNSLYGETLN
jgi:tRNA-2-methylthio-N6-dimethylallyladenosine synthase